MKKNIEVLDTSLRDGAQGRNIGYSVDDKLKVIELLQDLGIPFIEAGNPNSNPADKDLFRKISTPSIVAFGATRHKFCKAEEDENLVDLASLKCEKISIFGKSWDKHIFEVLDCPLEENLKMISESVEYLVNKNKKVFYDAEHFYDGFKSNKDYAVKTLNAAIVAGASKVILCDTNGGCMPSDAAEITDYIVKLYPQITIGVHFHNDCGMAVANTVIAVESGATHIQGTLLGIGERCGNACLSTIIPNLELKAHYQLLPKGSIAKLTDICKHIADLTNIALNPELPYVGENAFTHKAGMHCDGVLKTSHSFEHIPPQEVGNNRTLLISQLSGKSVITNKIKSFFKDKNIEKPQVSNILRVLKEKEGQGYAYEACDASFYILCCDLLGVKQEFFKLIDYKIISEQTGTNSAIIKLLINGNTQLSSGEGLGPVHALDNALRNALTPHYPILNKIWLMDYKVRVLNSEKATGAKVRVLITSTDGVKSWSTVGVSADIIQASFSALTDSIEYYLSNKQIENE